MTDPLAAVCAVLAELPCPAAVLPEREALRELRTALEACEAAPLGAGRRSLAAARDRIARLGPGERALQTDLALDADVRLPRRVSEDAERAAHLLWRLAPRQEGSAPLRAYHAAFLSRYGTDRLVPLAELIDPDVGLGTLEHHRASPGHGDTGADDLTPAVPTPAVPTPAVPKAAASPPSGTTTNGPGDRDGLLAALAQEALLDGTPEVLLTDDHPLVAALASDDGTPPPSLDLCGQLLAETPDDLASGDFRLVLTGAAPQATAMSGRFAGLLHAGHREQLAAVARSSATAVPGGADAAVQLTGPAGRSRAANIAHAPRLLPRVLSVGAFTDRTGITDSTTAVRGGGLADPVRDGAAQTPLSVAGLVVGADRRRLWLREAATGRVVTPAAFHVLHPESPELPPVARFLRELAGSGVRSWQPWDWGGAVALPWLPRVRYGTTVLAPARWLPTEELRDQRASFDAWSETLRRWRERWRVPDRVRVGHGDRRIELSCDQPEQARVLRHELGRDRRSVIQEAPTVAGCPDGWLRGHGGRAHRAEVVLPLVCTAAAPTVPPPPPGRPYQAGRPDAATGDGAGVEAPPDAGQRPGPQQLPGSQRRYGPPQGDRPQQEASPPQGAGPAPPYGADRAERAAPPRVHLPGGSWLSAVLYCRPERQDDILVGHLPYLLERLPPTVDRWFYVRYRDALGPHLRLRFHTADPEETNARVLPLVREFTETVLNAGIGQSLTLDTYRPEIERYGGPDALTAAERVFHADSLAALAQLSPLRDGRAALDPAVLSAAHQAACARAFHTGMTRDGDGGDAGRAPGDPSPSPGGSPSPGALPAPASGARAAGTAASRTAGTDPATGTGALAGAGSAEKSDGAMDGWWPLPAVRNPEADRFVRGHRDTVRDLTDPSRPVGQAPLVTLGLPPGPAADRLNVCWERRAEALIALGRTLRGLGPHATATPENVVSSVLHMLHNRLVGPDRDGERRAHALVSGGLRAHRGRTRHGPGASPRSRPEVAGRAR